MRRCSAKDRRQAQRRGFCLLAVLVLTAGVLSLNRYVNTVVKPTLHELAEYEARSAGDLLCHPVRQSDEQFTAERPWPRLAAVDPAQGVCAGGDTRDNTVAFHQYHTVQRGFAAVRHRQHDFGRQHGHADCCGGLSAGKPARLRRYSERLCLRFGLNLPPQMWYTKLIPTNGV